MPDNKEKNLYDDENIPRVDLPQEKSKDSTQSGDIAEPLPESFRPRKDGPGGE